MFDFFKNRRREKLLAEAFPEPFRKIIEKNVRYVLLLSDVDREELEKHVKVFLGEKEFEGANGVEVTDEMRVTIAAQACILLLHRKTDFFPKLDSIVVYPTAYRAVQQQNVGGVMMEMETTRLGESWSLGTVCLAWDHVKRGAYDVKDGDNVVLHEFAHQLDAEDGEMDGAPALDGRARYKEWAKVLGSEFDDLVSLVREGHRTDMDEYGATNPPEFFAVATETFFEKPLQLKARHEELYYELASFYAQDPASLLARAKKK